MEFYILILALIIASGILVWVMFMLFGEFSGAAFVPTGRKEIEEVLGKLDLVPGKMFYDLGSGDGRVVRTAVEKYRVKGIGVEINPWLILWSKWKASRENLKNIRFLSNNFWHMNLGEADYIYFYQSPKAAERLGKKMQKESNKGAIVISKAFEIKLLRKKLVEILVVNNRRYFVYRI